MPIIINGTTLGSDVYMDSTKLNKINFNDTTVWEGIPAWNDSGLEYNSWSTIASWLRAGRISEKVKRGDKKTFTVGSETFTAQVVSINDGSILPEYYPANTMDFISVELYNSGYRYKSSDNNSGGFPNSELPQVLSNIYSSKIGWWSSLYPYIVKKKHLYQTGYNTAGSGSSTWKSQMTEYSSYLWLPTYFELNGASSKFAVGENSTNNIRYLKIYSKYIINTTTKYSWWTSTPNTWSDQAFNSVDTSGSLTYGRATVENCVPICFRIG